MDIAADDNATLASASPDEAARLGDNLVDQLLLARGVARDDLERHRRPTLRDFLPDPSHGPRGRTPGPSHHGARSGYNLRRL